MHLFVTIVTNKCCRRFSCGVPFVCESISWRYPHTFFVRYSVFRVRWPFRIHVFRDLQLGHVFEWIPDFPMYCSIHPTCAVTLQLLHTFVSHRRRQMQQMLVLVVILNSSYHRVLKYWAGYVQCSFNQSFYRAGMMSWNILGHLYLSCWIHHTTESLNAGVCLNRQTYTNM